MALLPADEAIQRFKENEDRLDKFLNDPNKYTTSGGVDVESVPHIAATLEAKLKVQIEQELGASGAIQITEGFKNQAAASASAAAASAGAAAGSATSASASAGTATTKAGEANTSAVNAAASAVNAAASAASIVGASASGTVGFVDLATLNASLAYAAGTVAYVTNDATAANNGIYRKNGASGSGSWTKSTYDPFTNFENFKKDFFNETHVIRYNAGGVYLEPTTGVFTVRRSPNTAYTAGDTRLAVFSYNGTTYTLKGNNNETATLAIPNGNSVIYLNPADVGFDANNVTVANFKVQAGTSAPANCVPLAHVIYTDAINSRLIFKASDYNTSAYASAWNDDTADIYHVTQYDAGGLYWDRDSSQLIVDRLRSGGDARLFVLHRNGVDYTFNGTDGATKSFTLAGGNTTLYIDSATVTAGNVTIADIQEYNGIPQGLAGTTKIVLAWLVYGNAVNSRCIKDYKERPKNDVAITNVVYYSAKKIQYNPATFTLSVAGTDLPQDGRILIFDFGGIAYTVMGNAGSSAIRPLDGSAGNQFLVVDKTALINNTLSILNMFFTANSANTNYIYLGRLVWNTALTSQIVEIPSDSQTSSAISAITRIGEGDLFMAGKLSAEKQVFKLAIYGDSIYASGFKDITFPDEFGKTRYEQPPRNGNLDSIQRYIYNYLNFNKPTFRNALHADWTKTGLATNVGSDVMPNGNTGGVGDATQWEPLWRMTDTSSGNTNEITITGNSTAVFVFEGGAIGTDQETGNVSVLVSVNGGAFVNPSTVLSGKLTNKGFGSSKVYAAAQNTFATSFALPVDITPTAYNKNAPMVEAYYNGLNPANTYRFRITKAAAETRPVKLWGLYHFSGQTLLVVNESKPGFSWGELQSTVFGDLVVSDVDYVLLEAPMYHDNYATEQQVIASGSALIEKIQSYGIQVALCSCPPGGVIPAGRATTILGDENASSYHPGQHFAKYFDFFYYMATTDIPTSADSPAFGDVYSAVVNSVTYEFICTNSEFPLPTGHTYWQAPVGFLGFSVMPVTFTKVSGDGKASISYSSYKHGLTMAEHRNAMQKLALSNGYAFVDIYQAFVNIAKAVGEDLYTDGYDMDAGHPLYPTLQALDADNSNYPGLSAPYKMNYLTNFFDIGDGHHLANPAHPVIFEAVKNTLLKKSVFKQ